MPTTGLSPEQILDLEALALEETKLAAEAQAIAERRETIKGLLRDTLGQGTHTVGPFQVQVRAGARRLDTTALAAAFPPAQYPGLYKPALDTAAVKDQFAPVALAEFQVQGTPTVAVK